MVSHKDRTAKWDSNANSGHGNSVKLRSEDIDVNDDNLYLALLTKCYLMRKDKN